MRAVRSVETTLAVGVGLMALAGVLTLTRAPPRVVRAVAVNEFIAREEHVPLALATGDATICQTGEVLPAGVTGVRVWLRSPFGPPVRIAVYDGSRTLAQGSRGADWTGDSVTVPVRPLGRTSAHTRLCVTIGPNSELVVLVGGRASSAGATVSSSPPLTPAAVPLAGGRLGGRLGVEYLAAGRDSWWSRALAVARRMGLGRAFSGTWIALLVAALMLATGALAVRLLARELP
jgi:hypothetical protein